MTGPALKFIRRADQAVAALHPLRRAILDELGTPGSATTVAERLGLTRQKVNYHVRQLEEEGLVETVEERKKGNCTERIVRATARHFVLDPDLFGSLAATPGRVQDRMSSAWLVAVLARALRDVSLLRERADDAGKELATLSLETTLTFASPADQAAFAEEMARAVGEVVRRHHDPEAEEGRRFRLVMGSFPAPDGSDAPDEDAASDERAEHDGRPGPTGRSGPTGRPEPDGDTS